MLRSRLFAGSSVLRFAKGRSFSSFNTRQALLSSKIKPHFRNVIVTAATVASIIAAVAYPTTEAYSSDINKHNETAESISDSVSVDKGIPAFQRFSVTPSGTEQSLLGWGVRTVTFLRMKVYGLGLYVAREDLDKIPEILDSKYLSTLYETEGGNHRESLTKALRDPELSMILIENLLNSQVRFTAHIVPLRNTDFNHLRDGLIKSIMACPKSKELLAQPDTTFPEGLDELRKAFGTRRGSCPKGHSLFLELQKDASILITYQEVNSKTGNKTNHTLGLVKEPLVSKILFLQYLSGAKPLSAETRDIAVENLVSIC